MVSRILRQHRAVGMLSAFLRAKSFLWSLHGPHRPWLHLWCSIRVRYRFRALSSLTMGTLCYAVLAGPALGQGTGALPGTDQDSSGHIVVGAEVELPNPTT